MLIKFKVKNFKSFKELAELNLIKGKQQIHEERIANCAGASVLKFSSIFGANASGKSNLVRALKVMQFLIINNRMPSDAYNEYYKLDETSKVMPTYFEIIVSIDEHNYSYGFEIDLKNGNIVSEWLFELVKKSDGKTKELKIFERENNHIELYDNNKPVVLTSKNYRLLVYKEDVEKDNLSFMLNRIGINYLAFSEINKDSVIKPIYDVFMWFQKSLKVVYPNNTLITPEMLTTSNEKISKILNAFDTGITKIESNEVTERDFVKNNVQFGIDINLFKNLLMNQFKVAKSNKFMFNNPNGLWVVEFNGSEFKYYNYSFIHGENSEKFYSQDESDGTLRLFELIDAIATLDKNSVFVIDELDRCLHPRLTMQFVKTFLDRASDKNNKNQLIVTTHESRLLDLNLVRRDEVWFTDKKDGESKLYSLEEFNVRFDYVIDKAYMDGRFGGVPIFDKIYFSDMVKDENS